MNLDQVKSSRSIPLTLNLQSGQLLHQFCFDSIQILVSSYLDLHGVTGAESISQVLQRAETHELTRFHDAQFYRN